MPGDVIESAKSGRAGCRGCKQKIGKGELRFGEVDYTFDADGSFKWFHLPCAAQKVPTKLAEALEEFSDLVPDKEALLVAIAEGKKGSKPKTFPRAELDPSGRASCLGCQEKIKKGDLRVAIEREVDTGSFVAVRPGYLHPGCVSNCEHVEDASELLAALLENSELEAKSLEQLEAALN